jgi:putative tryptophan/tyrosine transport system substrate-binding protein
MRRRDLIVASAGASLWPLRVRAQRPATPVIGILGGASFRSAEPAVRGFHQGLIENGFVEGRNVNTEYRFAAGRFDRLPEMAADLVDRKVDVMLASGDPAALAAKNATSTIPIVFSVARDPVALGLVASFARPSTNLTGVNNMFAELTPKRLELLMKLVPRAAVIALLVNPNNEITPAVISQGQEAARTMALQLPILNASTETEIDAAFRALVKLRADAVIVGTDTFFYGQREQFVALAASHAVPTSYFSREFPASGGLISYGPNVTAVYRLLGLYAAKILNGASPTDLPVQQPTKFDLVINLKTAKTLGLTVPPILLTQADEMIE